MLLPPWPVNLPAAYVKFCKLLVTADNILFIECFVRGGCSPGVKKSGILPQVTVIFLVDVEKAMPSKEAWPTVWQEQLAWRKAKADHEAAATAKAAEVRWSFCVP